MSKAFALLLAMVMVLLMLPAGAGAAPGDSVVITGAKIWDDNNNAAGKRPKLLEISLYAGSEKIGTTQTAATSDWEFSFDITGRGPAEYTFVEEPVEDYTAAYVQPVVTVTPFSMGSWTKHSKNNNLDISLPLGQQLWVSI